MSTAPLMSTHGRLLSVRLDPGIRASLNELATGSDRSVSQLVRYALTQFLLRKDLVEVTSTVTEHETLCHTAVRVPEALGAQLDLVAAEYQVATSTVIRAALDTWLGQGPSEVLGYPVTVKVESR